MNDTNGVDIYKNESRRIPIVLASLVILFAMLLQLVMIKVVMDRSFAHHGEPVPSVVESYTGNDYIIFDYEGKHYVIEFS